jgi:hypothetical protein
MQERLRKDRPMTVISLRMPEDVIEELKEIAPSLGFSGYQPLIRAYIGQGLRKDQARMENSQVQIITESLRKHGIADQVISAAIAEAGRLQMRPKRLVDIGDDALTANESVMVRRGEAEIKAGRSKAWRKVKDERAEAPIARPETGRTTAKRRLGILETPGFVLSEKFNEPLPEEPS